MSLGPENFAQKLKMVWKNMFFFQKKDIYNEVFVWAAGMQQFWQSAEKLQRKI